MWHLRGKRFDLANSLLAVAWLALILTPGSTSCPSPPSGGITARGWGGWLKRLSGQTEEAIWLGFTPSGWFDRLGQFLPKRQNKMGLGAGGYFHYGRGTVYLSFWVRDANYISSGVLTPEGGVNISPLRVMMTRLRMLSQ